MRRSDREIKETDKLIEVIRKCDVCRLALNADGYPYILPLNFGMQVNQGRVVLYFHGATEGTKYELIKKDNRASFEMDCGHRLVMEEDMGNCIMEFESVIGRGLIEIITEDDQKKEALDILMSQYHQEEFSYNQEFIAETTVMKLTVEQMTGKALKKKHKVNSIGES